MLNTKTLVVVGASILYRSAKMPHSDQDKQRHSFRLVLLVALTSRLASGVFLLAIVLFALRNFPSPSIAGSIAFAALVPGLVTSPLSGAIIDRYGASRSVCIDFGFSAILVATLALLIRQHELGPLAAIVIVSCYSITSPLNAAGIRYLLPLAVTPDRLKRANALDTSIHAVVDVSGPMLAGILSTMKDQTYTFVLIAVLYLIALIGTIRGVLVTPSTKVGDDRTPIHQSALAGLIYVVRHRLLRNLAITYSFYQACWGLVFIATPGTIAGMLNHGKHSSLMTGVLLGLSGLGGGIGALISTHRRNTMSDSGTFTSCLALTGCTVAVMILAGYTGHIAIFGLGLVLAGLLAGPIDVSLLSLRQKAISQEILGKVLAISISLNMIGFPIGAFVGGYVISSSAVLPFVIALMCVGLAFLFALKLGNTKHYRRLDFHDTAP